MTSTKPEEPSVSRLPYEKPAMWSISLVADQVLATNCKSVAGYSPTRLGNLCSTLLCSLKIGS
jgi:hypothetical protein